jgi:hypothetical protein
MISLAIFKLSRNQSKRVDASRAHLGSAINYLRKRKFKCVDLNLVGFAKPLPSWILFPLRLMNEVLLEAAERRWMNNNWPFAEIKRRVEYKARWLGIPMIQLTKSETRGTSSICYVCRERLQSSREKPRLLWCKKWYDRDLVAVRNISHRGWMRFVHSKGIGGEAVNGNPTTAAIPRVFINRR